ncbi:MAG: CPBP family intramembrane metalloprotease [Spirochaetaceae bacterium]|nr:CPBP family intramembrane metalloprotease [Spirochaetaceae bacterium]
MKLGKNGWIFLGLTFALSWGLCAAAYAGGLRAGDKLFPFLGVAMMFMPLLAAVISVALSRGAVPLREALALRFRVGPANFLLSWLLFPAAVLLALGIGLALPGISYDPAMEDLVARLSKGLPPDQVAAVRASVSAAPIPPVFIAFFQGLLAGLSINALAAFGEEAGWRGLLFRELKGSSFFGGSLFAGLVWGLWHAPLILQGHNYPEHPVAGVFMMIAWCALLSPIFYYIRARTGSVAAAAVAHGTLNGVGGVAMMPLRGGSDLTVGFTGLAGFIAIALLLLALYVLDRSSGRRIMAKNFGEAGE